MPIPTILAIGFSVRAVAEACARAGYPCIAVDHFGDVDTRFYSSGNWLPLELSDTKALTESALGTLQAIASEHLKTGRSLLVLLAGGMENLPQVVKQLETIGPVLGPNAMQIELLRNHRLWQAAAEAAAMGFPAVATERPGDGSNRQWLWKPSNGAGGLQIGWGRPADLGTSAGMWQQFITGRQIGVTCIAHSDATEFIGATLSLSAADWPGPTEFIYRGSCGPFTLSPVLQQQVVAVAEHFRKQSGVRGWIQCDFIEDRLGDLWLLECNPRWTAGMEVLILAGNSQLVEKHVRATNGWEDGEVVLEHPSVTGCVAKAVVYATQDLELTQPMIERLLVQMQPLSQSFSWLADVPSQPQRIQQGHPIATVRCQVCSKASVASVLPSLQQLRERLLVLCQS